MNRRHFLQRSLLASASATAVATTPRAAGTDADAKNSPATPKVQGSLPTGKLGGLTISRLIAGGNLLSGWCHQRDLRFVRNLAEAYLTKTKQFDTLQQLEEAGVNTMVIDQMQLEIVNQYKRQRGGALQTVVGVRQNWGDWSKPDWPNLQEEILRAIDRGGDTLYLHGGYADRLVQAGQARHFDVIGRALQFIRDQGLIAGLGSHALEVPKACVERGLLPDYYVKTFHHDRYWSATPRDRRKPFCVDGPVSLDHNEFHDNIFCLDPEATAAFMRGQTVPWIAFKVLAAGAIDPQSGFSYAFTHGADFLAVGMFDFEIEEDVQTLKDVLKNLKRERPWAG